MHRSYKKIAMLIANINLVTVVTIQKQYTLDQKLDFLWYPI